jgi:hypothetical protein
MPAALETVDAGSVSADGLGLQRVAHRGALVNHLDACLVQHGHRAIALCVVLSVVVLIAALWVFNAVLRVTTLD